MPRRRNDLDQLRTEIAALAAAKHLRRYSEDLRRRVVTHASGRLGAGESQAAIAKSLGMSDPTLSRFMGDGIGGGEIGRDRAPRRRRATRALVPIAVTPDEVVQRGWSTADRRIVVRGPCGLVIEGLSIEAVAELISRVSACSG